MARMTFTAEVTPEQAALLRRVLAFSDELNRLADGVGQSAFRVAKGAVEFTVDAGKVNTREEGWKDLKIGVFQKREAGTPVPPSGWEGQRLPAATARVAFAEVTPAKRFQRRWRRWSKRLGVSQPAELFVLGDGAAWIWRGVERAFTGCVQTLDVYHASAHLAAAAGQLYGEGTTAARAALDRVTGYFAQQVARLGYTARLAEGRAIGSGAVEGQAKTLGLRLKARGARWNTRNVRPMASLVCVRHSDQGDTYWATAA